MSKCCLDWHDAKASIVISSDKWLICLSNHLFMSSYNWQCLFLNTLILLLIGCIKILTSRWSSNMVMPVNGMFMRIMPVNGMFIPMNGIMVCFFQKQHIHSSEHLVSWLKGDNWWLTWLQFNMAYLNIPLQSMCLAAPSTRISHFY